MYKKILSVQCDPFCDRYLIEINDAFTHLSYFIDDTITGNHAVVNDTITL